MTVASILEYGKSFHAINNGAVFHLDRNPKFVARQVILGDRSFPENLFSCGHNPIELGAGPH